MRRSVLVTLGAIGLVGGLLVLLVVGVSWLLSGLSDCSGRERAVLEDIHHYGDRQIATYPWTFSCTVRYTADGSREEVLGYYDEWFSQNGWVVEGFSAHGVDVSGDRLSDLAEAPESASVTLSVRRGDYWAGVEYYPPNPEDPDAPPSGEALVIVGVQEKG